MNKGTKTTIAASVTMICGIACLGALILGKIDTETFGIAMGSVATLGASVIGLLSKDQNATHTQK